MQTEKLLYRVCEAADVLGVSRAHCYELINQGVVPQIRLGKSIRVPRAALEEFITKQLSQRVGA